MAATTQSTEAPRRLANFAPTVWGHEDFASFASDQDSVYGLYTKRVEELKVQVKDVLLSTNDIVEKVELIDLLGRLGISYHFESEIEDQLRQNFDVIKTKLVDDNDYGLYAISLLFRVFRQHGYKMSCDVFDKFKGDDGKLKKSLASDVKGMLSLYEASHLSMHGEDVLDEALGFSKTSLHSMVTLLNPHFANQVSHALQQPYHKGIPRIESRQYINFYEEDESRNEILLKLAKIDFNRVQLLHQQELSHVSRWYKDLEIASKFPYARDRIAEIYMWTVGSNFEPHYGRVRIFLTKSVTMISILDDTYDAYGTIEELRLLTDAIDGWDIGAIDELPDYMKVLYKMILNLYDEFEHELRNEGRSSCVAYARDALREMVKAYHVEAEWCNKGYVPTFDEYMENALITSCYHAIPAACFLGMGDIAGRKEFEWLKSIPKIVRASEMIGRLMDDIMSHKEEQKRGHVASSVECFMKQYGVSTEEEVVQDFQIRVANAWKDINEECVRPTAVSLHLLMPILNLTRIIDVVYKKEDGYSNPVNLKEHVKSLFIQQIPMQD
ncbi:probable terpene synthase 6 [Tripterygium wilfordii]|uniref:probable terpene synthase 6 n=1 Tax=Tripterygium wilfordii TaxID=458696 RepID=UPI0018F82AC6|nr:probable terpene synthase 6 [Tripterygium wilfordii]